MVHLVPEQRNELKAGVAGVNSGEGGRLRMNVKVDNNLRSGTFLTNHVDGCYGNETEGPLCVSDDSSVEVQNPDLYLRKTISNTEPHRGEEVGYSIIVSNEGKIDAPGVILTDKLPAGLCYKAGSTMIMTAGWKLGEPTISGGDCNTNPTTLTWSGDNAIKRDDLESALIPGSSGNIRISYTVKVGDNVAFGTELDNLAKVSTTSPEAPVYPNEDSAELTTATPDPYIEKTASSPSVLPGETFNYLIRYGNTADETARGAYIVDSFPDANRDQKTDVTVLSVTPGTNETVYYYDALVSGDLPSISADYDFAGNDDFKTSLTDFDPNHPTNPSYPTHMIIVNAGKAGNGTLGYYEYSGQIKIEAQATDPFTGTILPAGSEWKNTVVIDSSTEDGNLDNNTSSATVAVPAADLSIDKTADIEGSYPGLAPGDTINYKVTYKNSGVGSVCGVWIQDTIPNEVASYVQNFTNVRITDAQGNAMQLLDRGGSPIDSSTMIPVGYDDSDPNHPKWYIGLNDGDTNAPEYYQNVCLPTGAQGEFQVYVTLSSDLENETPVTNKVHIDQDSGATEQILDNNDDSSTTTVYRADLMLVKTGVSAGRDGIFGTTDDTTDEANAGDQLRYRLEYNNIGNITAKESVITENIPVDICFTVGSIASLPATAKVSYSNDEGSTWNYAPNGESGDQDCNVTNFRIELGDLSAPANMLSGDMSVRAAPGEPAYETTHVDVMAGKTVTDGTAGQYHTCAIADGKAYCWGMDSNGQLGDGNSITSPEHGVLADKTLVQIASRVNTTCAIDTDGRAYCWGLNTSGQFGNNTTNNSSLPVEVYWAGELFGKKLVQISAGGNQTCAIDDAGQAYCWGEGNQGQMGNGLGTDSYIPVPVNAPFPGGTFKHISAGYSHVCGIASDDQVYCWGYDSYGTLGNGSVNTSNVYVPMPVDTTNVPEGVTALHLAAGDYSNCMIGSDQKVYCWGMGNAGQIGNGLMVHAHLPTAVDTTGVLAGKNMTQVKVGYSHACAKRIVGAKGSITSLVRGRQTTAAYQSL